MAGRLPRPQSLSLKSLPQPPSRTHRSQSSNVISNLLTANGTPIVTRCWVSAFCSEGGDPIVNSPAGTTTICGQSAQSLNSVKAPETFQIAGGAERRCSADSVLRVARPDATSSAVWSLSSAILDSNCRSVAVFWPKAAFGTTEIAQHETNARI